MSSAKARLQTARTALMTLMLGLPLAGCFQPLYAPSVLGDHGAATQLSNIAVADIPDRMGHFLHAELQFQLGGGSIPTAPAYQLEVKTRTTHAGRARRPRYGSRRFRVVDHRGRLRAPRSRRQDRDLWRRDGKRLL